MRNTLTLSYICNTNYTFEYINISYSSLYREVVFNKYASIEYRINAINETL